MLMANQVTVLVFHAKWSVHKKMSSLIVNITWFLPEPSSSAAISSVSRGELQEHLLYSDKLSLLAGYMYGQSCVVVLC